MRKKKRFLFLVSAEKDSLASDLRLEINTDSEIEQPENTKADAKRDFRVCLHNALFLLFFPSQKSHKSIFERANGVRHRHRTLGKDLRISEYLPRSVPVRGCWVGRDEADLTRLV